ncbi:UDP-N-acetylmuramoyl-L-alanyl-D-glutamate--2,6-diaminopimelate ligase [Peptoniphilus asaccharolyticus DSM 20463]|uniref:UDP-N-acetylmuramoyl-L-alanyl-D-glutamate--2,6-diaminopimelate ligase n=1 Tax=Peptoniphilus asaccharolyticus DSM 20463 TaxID=573058 RepID=A0A1W1USF9_PEPAS|nr:Mur ligase family protein [Peptoniphilus asaccharolyticus]MBL7575125.1 UDP-N-acetylmuramoylalanyl-D-glutamate--2,6-diaminopimelate ligase [Peptoniphilus asaccharolyticus]SMB83949.1 UDP-N-acetylmuramoyl-L-alanyl-D-glutamate--2,6-diaminopimelate ligase [Peptoniphilus asaccharolyticus DSM 20463]
MKLSQLVDNFNELEMEDLEIKNIRYNSNDVEPGDLFVAIKGYVTDGHKYVKNAYESGAVVAIVEDYVEVDIPQIQVENSRIALADMSHKYFGEPSTKLNMVGITATNGKTTTSFMLDTIYRLDGYRTGIIGTVYTKYADVMVPSILTTPESYDLQRYLYDMVGNNIEKVTMEVSSSAQELYRNKNIDFDIVTFNNFSREHIDQHGSFENYYKFKSRLIREAQEKTACVLNMDFEEIERLAKETKGKVVAYSLENSNYDFTIKDLDLSTGFGKYRFEILKEVNFNGVKIAPDSFEVELSASGFSSVMNSVAAIIVALLEGIDKEIIIKALKLFTGVERRCEMIYDGDFKVLDDHFANVRNIDVTLDTLKQMSYKDLHVLYAIRGSRGVELNRETSERMVEWFEDLHLTKVFATLSKDVVGKKDIVLDEELEVFKEIMSAHNMEYEIIDTLADAMKSVLGEINEGDVLLLAGCQGMDKGAGFLYDELLAVGKPNLDILKDKVENRIC